MEGGDNRSQKTAEGYMEEGGDFLRGTDEEVKWKGQLRAEEEDNVLAATLGPEAEPSGLKKNISDLADILSVLASRTMINGGASSVRIAGGGPATKATLAEVSHGTRSVGVNDNAHYGGMDLRIFTVSSKRSCQLSP